MEISVIVPVYNSAAHLARCLDSIFAQTFQDFELICADDGSTDESLDILRTFAASRPAMRVLQLDHTGPGCARNAGLKEACGQFVAFLDSDDTWEPTFLQRPHESACAHNADMVLCQQWHLSTQTGEKPVNNWPGLPTWIAQGNSFTAHDIPETIFALFGNEVWGKLFRRQFLEDNHLRLAPYFRTEDAPFTCSAYVLAKRLVCISEPLMTYYRYTGTSAMDTTHVAPLDFLHAMNDLKASLVQHGLYDTYQKAFVNHALGCIVFNMKALASFDAFAQAHAALLEDAANGLQLPDCAPELFTSPEMLCEYLGLLTNEAPQAAYQLFRAQKGRADAFEQQLIHAWSELDQARQQLANAQAAPARRTPADVLRAAKRRLRP
ncbi:MAG: glycosyltransferase [Coriobacteriia bacterium]|nr:glycosyltransferase [Coriobacteriia bacterium]